MRKILAAILAVLLALSLCACGETEAIPSDSRETLSSLADTSASKTDALSYEERKKGVKCEKYFGGMLKGWKVLCGMPGMMSGGM